MSDLMKPVLAKIALGQSLSVKEAEESFELLMTGQATPSQIGAFLMGLRVKGETVEEITGAAKVMRAKAAPITAPEGAIDTCGTGGDAKGTHNISTAAALVAAACGVPVAKHGNKALSSKSGSADVLSALGIDLDADMGLIEQAMNEVGIGFMMAPRHHAAMKYVGPTRVELGTRTIFNLLGPLSNPAGTKRQLMGVFSADWLEPIAHALKDLGLEKAWVVHGEDGLDEITLTGKTDIAELKNGKVTRLVIKPEDFGLTRCKPEDLTGGTADENAAKIRAVFNGEKGPVRDIILINAAAALLVADKVQGVKDGMNMAAEAIDSGKAMETLNRLAAISTGKA